MASADTHEFRTSGSIRTFVVALVLLVIAGLVWANSTTQFMAYILVLSAAVAPSALWMRMESPGIPVLPAICLAYIPYFAWPILRVDDTILNYSQGDLFNAANTVVLFLICATIGWRLILHRWKPMQDHRNSRLIPSRVVWFSLTGLYLGLAYVFLSAIDVVDLLGPFIGLARAIALTVATVACFLIGVCKAQGLFSARAWLMAVVGLVLMVVISWSTLLLVQGVLYSFALVFGYSLVTRRIPWQFVVPIIIAVTVLQAGKSEIREKYWDALGFAPGTTRLADVPEIMGDWISDGVYAITSGKDYATPLDRTSLLHMVLLAESATPNQVDYLRGETYALLPSILVPRFIESNRPSSQVGMDLLNIRFGLLTSEGATHTAIGWGLVAEAYANFGYVGVIGVALLLGVVCGLLQNWSRKAEIISLPILTNIAVMMVLINIELDFIQVCSILLQSFAGLLAFFVAFRLFALR